MAKILDGTSLAQEIRAERLSWAWRRCSKITG